MARISFFLGLLGLMLGCGRSETNRVEIKMTSNPPKAFKTEVRLQCVSSYMEIGVYWVLQRSDHTTQFITYVSVRSKTTPEIINGYKAEKAGNNYQLTIASFEEENQGIYYCILHRNQALFFSSGLEVHLPKPSPMPPTIPHKVSTRPVTQNIRCLSPKVSETESSSMKLPCDLYIFAPLAGGCFVLLVIVVITMSVCCGLRKRRICRCKRILANT
ncbi:T-cell surface glycoprotein CD8 alpha chain isoform X2 [Elgaria multicarinata webbii]|uniref:T-cell surface glycoprotein CD8 alpha chain isoform X2 n=1 Tax=Elgaria multicarinata webbii TaxID=159646 RepID=UPI002FCD5930